MSMCKLHNVCPVSTDTGGFTGRVWRILVVFSKDERCWGITEKKQLLAVVAVGSRVSVGGRESEREYLLPQGKLMKQFPVVSVPMPRRT